MYYKIAIYDSLFPKDLLETYYLNKYDSTPTRRALW